MKDAARVVIVLDRSGSMESVRAATVDSFNEFISGQMAEAGECSVKLVLFDKTAAGMAYDVVFDKPLASVPALTTETYVPRGTTPLHDAMGRAITELGAELAVLPEAERPNKVIVVTITDGLENASQEYTQTRIAEIVSHQREVYKWDFVFLGANQDAVLTAERLDIPKKSAITYNANERSLKNVVGQALNKYAIAARKGEPAAFSEEDREKARR